MPRPVNCRNVSQKPVCCYFKPVGVAMKMLEEIELTIDELEAVRLSYLEGLYQADAAERMDISRQTLGRILETANKKIADVLVNGKALKIQGGNVRFTRNKGQGRGFGRGRACRRGRDTYGNSEDSSKNS